MGYIKRYKEEIIAFIVVTSLLTIYFIIPYLSAKGRTLYKERSPDGKYTVVVIDKRKDLPEGTNMWVSVRHGTASTSQAIFFDNGDEYFDDSCIDVAWSSGEVTVTVSGSGMPNEHFTCDLYHFDCM